MKIDLAGLLFPRRCPVCHETVEEPGELACGICRLKLPYINGPACRKCGKPLLSGEREYCMDCRNRRHHFRQGKAPFVYDKLMRESIARFKYGGRKEYAAFYAEEILRRCWKEAAYWKPEVLVPIPLHPSRKRKRGFNQAQLVAERLSQKTGIPMDAGLLRRVKKTHAQKELSGRDRAANLRGAFSIRDEKVPYKKILLVDDIYTTGSTMDEAARMLLEHGAGSVYFLCICVGSGT